MRTRLAVFAAIVFAAVLGFGSSAPMGAEAAGPGTWTAAADSPFILEAGQSGVLLPSGRVLFLGFQNAVVIKVGMRYNPATNSWDTTGFTTDEHRWGSLTLLRDGRALTAGGVSLPNVDAIASSETYSPFTNGWTMSGSMIEARYYHTAALLTDGRVLVAGGCGAGSTPNPFDKCPTGSLTPRLASAELFDPLTNTWSAAAPMTAARVFHTSTLLPDGRVVVTGGMSDPPTSLASAEIYDPLADTWTPIPNMSVARRSHSATLLPGGRVLVAGGEDATSTAEIYDPALNTWAGAGTLPLTYVRGSATLLGNGKVLVADYGQSTAIYAADTNTWSVSGDLPFGGNNGGAITLLHDGRALIAGGSSVLVQGRKTALYDATSWRVVAPPAVARVNHTATVLWNGKVLVAGGGSATAELYDEATNTWSAAGTMSAPREIHAAARMNDGRVLVVGGSDGPNTGSNHLLTAEIYNPNTNSWSAAASPTLDHVGDSAAVLPDGRVLVYGGGVDVQPEIYNPATNSWSIGAANLNAGGLPGLAQRTIAGRVLSLDLASSSLYDPATDAWTGLSYPGPFVPGTVTQLEGSTKIVMSGGSDVCPMAQLPASSAVVIFDGATEVWSTGATLATPRNAHTGTSLYNGRLLVAGGGRNAAACLTNPRVTLASAELYDQPSNTWTSAGSMTTARQSHTATLLPSGNVLVVGGSDGVAVVGPSELHDTSINTDTDGDGYNDGLELALGQHPWLNCKTMRADVSGDGLVNVADLGRVASKVGVRPPPSRIDQNGDKIVNVADLGLVASKSGQSVLSCV